MRKAIVVGCSVTLAVALVAAAASPVVACATNADCDDGQPCTDDRCTSVEGAFVCTNAPVDALCDDGNECTEDRCSFVSDDTCSSVGGAFVCTHSQNTKCNFECYEIRRDAFSGPTVTLKDQFGSVAGVFVQRPEVLCAPADKQPLVNPRIPASPEHLTGYRVRHAFTKVLNQKIVSPMFGTTFVDVLKPERLLVPSTKSLQPPSGPAPNPSGIDHYQCYKVRHSKGTPPFVAQPVTIQDQFGTVSFTLKKPLRLCAPVNKNGERPGADNRPSHLLCYKTSVVPFGQVQVYLNDQFGPSTKELIRRQEFCTPVEKIPVCGNGTLEAGETCDPPDTQAACVEGKVGMPCRPGMHADCDTDAGGDGLCRTYCPPTQVCNASCTCEALTTFCKEKTPVTAPPAMSKRCIFPFYDNAGNPSTVFGTACNVNADCDDPGGAGNGICNPNQHDGVQRPLQGGWDANNENYLCSAPPAKAAAKASCKTNTDCDSAPGTLDGRCGFTGGTLGSFPRRDSDNKMVMLSNNHVFARSTGNIVPPQATIGDIIRQPSVILPGLIPGPVAGALADYEPFCFSAAGPDCKAAGSRLNRRFVNCIDAAIANTCSGGATILDGGDILDVGVPAPLVPANSYGECTAPIANVGKPCHVDADCDSPAGPDGSCTTAGAGCNPTLPALGLIVKKSGARTGLTCGQFIGISDPAIAYAAGTADFRAQIDITALPNFSFNGNFTCGGDSGSLVLGIATDRPIGLHFSGNANGSCSLGQCNTAPFEDCNAGTCGAGRACVPNVSVSTSNPINLVLERFKLHF